MVSSNKLHLSLAIIAIVIVFQLLDVNVFQSKFAELTVHQTPTTPEEPNFSTPTSPSPSVDTTTSPSPPVDATPVAPVTAPIPTPVAPASAPSTTPAATETTLCSGSSSSSCSLSCCHVDTIPSLPFPDSSLCSIPSSSSPVSVEWILPCHVIKENMVDRCTITAKVIDAEASIQYTDDGTLPATLVTIQLEAEGPFPYCSGVFASVTLSQDMSFKTSFPFYTGSKANANITSLKGMTKKRPTEERDPEEPDADYFLENNDNRIQTKKVLLPHQVRARSEFNDGSKSIARRSERAKQSDVMSCSSIEYRSSLRARPLVASLLVTREAKQSARRFAPRGSLVNSKPLTRLRSRRHFH